MALLSSTSSSQRHSSKSKHHIVVDLTSPSTEGSLNSLLAIPDLKNKVTSVTVTAKPALQGRTPLRSSQVCSVFQALGALPNLVSVTVELNHNSIAFPVAALFPLLQRGQMQKLKCKDMLWDMAADSDVNDWARLRTLAQKQIQLEVLALDACRGRAVNQALVQYLPAIKDLRIVDSPLLLRTDKKNDHAFVNLLLKPTLESLKLEDVPDLDDTRCVAFVKTISGTTCPQLQEFHLSSSVLTDVTARAVALMLIKNGSSISKFTLHLDSEEVGTWMAHVLKHNTKLEAMDVRLSSSYDLSMATLDCRRMANALVAGASTTKLQNLRIRFEDQVPLWPTTIGTAFATMLKVNTNLQFLSLDDGISRFRLTPDMKVNLQLNQCGIRNLWAFPASLNLPSSTELVQVLVKTVEHAATVTTKNSPSGGLDAIFYLLSNAPELTYLALSSGALEGDYNSPALAHSTSYASLARSESSSSLSSVASSLSASSISSSSRNDLSLSSSRRMKGFGSFLGRNFPQSLLKKRGASAAAATAAQSLFAPSA